MLYAILSTILISIGSIAIGLGIAYLAVTALIPVAIWGGLLFLGVKTWNR